MILTTFRIALSTILAQSNLPLQKKINREKYGDVGSEAYTQVETQCL